MVNEVDKVIPLEIAFLVLTKALLGREGVGANREQRTLDEKVQSEPVQTSKPVHGEPVHDEPIVLRNGESPETITSVLEGPVNTPTLSSPLLPSLERGVSQASQPQPDISSAEPPPPVPEQRVKRPTKISWTHFPKPISTNTR